MAGMAVVVAVSTVPCSPNKIANAWCSLGEFNWWFRWVLHLSIMPWVRSKSISPCDLSVRAAYSGCLFEIRIPRNPMFYCTIMFPTRMSISVLHGINLGWGPHFQTQMGNQGPAAIRTLRVAAQICSVQSYHIVLCVLCSFCVSAQHLLAMKRGEEHLSIYQGVAEMHR